MIEQLSFIAENIKTIGILISAVLAGWKIIQWFGRIVEGIRCDLRSHMVRIYYHHKDEKKIRQYESENFIKLYEAYKALKGNSFIDDVYKEVMTWEVIT